MKTLSLQDTYAPRGCCFGCGPANEKGLQIKSFASSDLETTCQWHAQSHHEAFPGVLSGGIIGTLLDCHSNWAAAWSIMKKNNLTELPCTVTADYHIKLLRPTPTSSPIQMHARVLSVTEDRAEVEATLTANQKITATCKGLFVAVKPGHPAYNRWNP